jgi:hypothetical protein
VAWADRDSVAAQDLALAPVGFAARREVVVRAKTCAGRDVTIGPVKIAHGTTGPEKAEYVKIGAATRVAATTELVRIEDVAIDGATSRAANHAAPKDRPRAVREATVRHAPA